MDNTKIVEQLIEGFAKKSTEMMPLDEDIVVISPLSPDKPYRGKEQVTHFFHNLIEKMNIKSTAIEQHITSGHIVCTLWEIIMEPNLKLSIFSYYEIEKGKIKLMKSFYDPRHLLEKFKRTSA